MADESLDLTFLNGYWVGLFEAATCGKKEGMPRINCWITITTTKPGERWGWCGFLGQCQRAIETSTGMQGDRLWFQRRIALDLISRAVLAEPCWRQNTGWSQLCHVPWSLDGVRGACCNNHGLRSHRCSNANLFFFFYYLCDLGQFTQSLGILIFLTFKTWRQLLPVREFLRSK